MRYVRAIIAVVMIPIFAAVAYGVCPLNGPSALKVGKGKGSLRSGSAVLYGPSMATIEVVGSIGAPNLIFVGVGGGGAGGSAGGSGFAGNPNNDNGGGGGGGAGAPLLAFSVTAKKGDAFEVSLGSGGTVVGPGGRMGTPGAKGGDGSGSIVRRHSGSPLLTFPGATGGAGGIGSTNQPAVASGGSGTQGGSSGGAGGAVPAPPSEGGKPSQITPAVSIGGGTDPGNGAGGGGGGSALCVGGNGGHGGTFAGAPGDAKQGLPGTRGAGGGGAGARGEGGEPGLVGGVGGNGVVIVLWGDDAKDFPTAVAGPTAGVTLSPAGLKRVRDAIAKVGSNPGDFCTCAP